jgi:hypothetical protein
VLPAEDFTFTRNGTTKDGQAKYYPHPNCKPCRAAKSRKEYWDNPELRLRQVQRVALREGRVAPLTVPDLRFLEEPECALRFGCLNCPFELCVHDRDDGTTARPMDLPATRWPGWRHTFNTS